MPALPSVAKVLRCALSGTLAPGSVWLSRFFLLYTGTAPTDADLNTFASSMIGQYSLDLKSLAGADTVLLQAEAIDLSSPTSAIGISTDNVAGTRAGGVLPAQVCAVSSYEIGRRYRGGHPRGYWPFGTDTDLSTPAEWLAGFVTACNTGLVDYFGGLAGSGWGGAGAISHVNVSYYHGFTVVTSPTTGRARNVPTVRGAPLVDAVQSILVRGSIGTQRRRMAFVD